MSDLRALAEKAVERGEALSSCREEADRAWAIVDLQQKRLDALEAVAEAARNYLAWRARRLEQWQAVVDCGHEDNDDCPEMVVIRSEPFDMDVTMDKAIDAALAAIEGEATE